MGGGGRRLLVLHDDDFDYYDDDSQREWRFMCVIVVQQVAQELVGTSSGDCVDNGAGIFAIGRLFWV